MSLILSCGLVEELLADYFDQTLSAEKRSSVEQHLAGCTECCALAGDVSSALQFLRQVEEPPVPPYLVNRILQWVPTRWSERLSRNEGNSGWFYRLISPLVQPRLVMGAMLTVLSLSMMTRCAGAPNHALTASDLDPVKVWSALDGRMHRIWERTLKAYESMRVVYEVQNRLREWKQSENDPAAGDAALEIRKVHSDAVPSNATKSSGNAAPSPRDAAPSNTQ